MIAAESLVTVGHASTTMEAWVPSSLLFAGLVATWLAVLVPMAARRRAPMSRPSDAALSSRVLNRPRPRAPEVNTMPITDPAGSVAGEPATSESAEYRAELPRQRGFRPGRGGYDAEAAALAARAQYAFRQRLVLALALLAVASGVIAAVSKLNQAWAVHGALLLGLVGYLVYLRRQVRLEQEIRARRAARMAGSRRRTVADAVREAELRRAGEEAEDTEYDEFDDYDELDGYPGADDEPEPAEEQPNGESGLPRLRPAAPPSRPDGTVVLELDDEDPGLHDLDHETQRGYRRASGQ